MARSSTDVPPSGAQSPLSPLIHGRVRLLVLSFLLAAERPVPFMELRGQLGLTDGSLSVHLTKLEAGGMISLEKRFLGKRPQTLIRVTSVGQKQFKKYVRELKRIVPGLDT